MAVLLTGGAGYIGSHTCVELLNNGYDVVIADNFDNASEKAVDRIEKITGKSVAVYKIDVADKKALRELFSQCDIDAVIHFAGYKAVGESVEKPLMYYRNNLDTTLTLLEVMGEFNVKKIVFSSSATVYGVPEVVPLKEGMPTSCTNPYGWTKLFNEQILTDATVADSDLSVVLLRYFNPIGAHESGLIGESPNGIPNNLMPYITQVAVGKREKLGVFGNDYDTHDGTGVRDYIHVVDLANGHLKALEYINNGHKGTEVFNLGTGTGYSVLDIVKTFSKVNNIEIPYVIMDRRPGDVAIVTADPKKANEQLCWTAQRGLEEMCKDSWNWQSNNPNGYEV
ncbi:MAG: UDP-glucose 4-epimerase GalE [Ruminococcaceae bacterium]|nr:UDP-glucose 4-epimerase GalE [Oscillospiraceae bacterium]